MAASPRCSGLLLLAVLFTALTGVANAWCGDHGGPTVEFSIEVFHKGGHNRTMKTKCHDCGVSPWHPPTVGDCWSCHNPTGEHKGYPYSCPGSVCSDQQCEGEAAPPPPPPAPPTPAGSVGCMCCSGSWTKDCIPHYVGWAISKEDCASR